MATAQANSSQTSSPVKLLPEKSSPKRSPPGRPSKSNSPSRGLSAEKLMELSQLRRPPSRGPSSKEFSEQIDSLDIEGSKLMTATQALGESLLGTSLAYDANLNAASLHNVSGNNNGAQTSPSSLSALTDISEEQRTISQLRSTLDAQARETERLTQSLRHGNHHSSYSTLLPSSGGHSNLLSSLDIPTSTPAPYHQGSLYSTSSTPALHSALDFGQQSHLERKLRESQEQIIELRAKLREALRLSEENKSQYRVNVEELRSQLQTAVNSREQAYTLRTRENSNNEANVQRLQSTMEQLQQTNRIQEQSLLEVGAKMETLQKDQYASDTLTAQLRSLILDREHKRGRPFYDSEPVTRQSMTMLVHSLERCIQDLESESESRQQRNRELSVELDSVRATVSEKQQASCKEYTDKLTQLAMQHENELTTLMEKASASRKQATNLQEQLTMLQSQQDHQARLKDDRIHDLELRLTRVTEERDEEAARFKQKREGMEHALDELQKEAAAARSDRDDMFKKASQIESQFDKQQDVIHRLESDLENERTSLRKLLSREDGVATKIESLTKLVEQKNNEIERLKDALQTVKEDSHQQLQSTVENVQRDYSEKHAQQVKALTAELTAATEKAQAHHLELELLRTEHRSLTERYNSLEHRHSELQAKLDTAEVVKGQLSETAAGRQSDIERLSQERDTYFKLLGEKDSEAINLRGQVEKLTVTLEERERAYRTAQEESDRARSSSESHERELRSLREGKEHASAELSVRNAEVDELKNARENLTRKLKVREKHMRSLEEDNAKMAEALQQKKLEFDQVVNEKDEMFREMKAAQHELSLVKDDKERLQKDTEEKYSALKKECARLNTKLKASEQDLKLTRQTLKTYTEADGKAVRVAGKMQREVTEKRGQIDALQSKVLWLEEALEHTVKEKKTFHEENEKLGGNLKRSMAQNERLTREMEEINKRNGEYRDRMAKLEGGLEKAAVKNASSQAQLEQYEQDIARLKLKHQLELKEMERSGHVNRYSAPVTMATGDQSAPSTTQYPATAYLSPAVTGQSTNHLIGTALGGTTQTQTLPQMGSNEMDGGMKNELQTLLGEMRTLIHGQKHKRSKHHHQLNETELTQPAASEFDETVDSSPEHPPRRSRHKPRSSKNSNHRVSSRPVKSNPKTTHTVHESSYSPSSPTFSPLMPEPRHDRSLSPTISGISFFNSPERGGNKYDALSELSLYSGRVSTSSTENLILEDLYENTSRSGSPTTPPRANSTLRALRAEKVDEETQALCKRLEDKLESLSKIGSTLQQENREVNSLLKKEDKRLREVWQNEKGVKHLVRV